MTCRHPLLVALGLVFVVSGCTFPIAGLRIPPGDGNGDVVHQAATYVAFGDFRAAAGFSTDQPPQMQQQYRDDARLSYLKAIEVDPKHMPAYLALARLQQRSEDLAGAVTTFEKALAVNARDPGLWFELAMCRCRQKNWDEAIAGLQKALELSPANRNYLTTLGYTFGRAGRLADSLTLLTEVEGEARALYDLARMLRHMNQLELARQYTAAALQRDPNMPGLQQFAADLNGNPGAAVQSAGYQPQPESVPAPAGPRISAPVFIPAGGGALKAATPQPSGAQMIPARAIRVPPLPVIRAQPQGP